MSQQIHQVQQQAQQQAQQANQQYMQQYQQQNNFYRQPSPGVVTVHKETPYSTQPHPVYAQQPAANRFGGKYVLKQNLV